jgi:hypothetical protein
MGLVGNEFVEICIGEHAMPTHPAAAEGDVFQLTRLYVDVERLGGTTELGGGLCSGLEPVRWGLARLALLASYRSRASCF